jgi:hypothetical protein
MSRGNFDHNYPLVIKYLEDHDIPYEEYNAGQHLRIIGPTALVDLWPSRMKYHILQTENVDPNAYLQLNISFDEKELERIL